MSRWFRNTVISLLIGGGFLWLAVRDWHWADIEDSFRPLPPSAAWLSLEADGPVPEGVQATVERDGAVIQEVTLRPSRGGLQTHPLDPARLTGGVEGWWTLRTEPAVALKAWSVDFRSPEARAARDRPGDPWVFAASPGARVRVRSIAWLWVLPYLLAFGVIHLARILRFGVLLRPLARLSLWRLTLISSVGYMAIIVLPLRLGEFVRPYLVTEDGVSFSGALGACVVERVLDGLAVCGLLFGAVALAAASGASIPPSIYVAGGLALTLFLSTLVVLLLSWWKRDLTLRVLRAIGEPISKGLTDKALALVDGFLDGVASLPNRRLVAAIFGLTALYWSANIAGHWFLLQAAGVVGPTGADLGLIEAAAIMAILAIGIILPAGPGFAGNFEAAARLGMTPFVTAEVLLTRGAAWTLLIHSITLLLQAGIGLAFLATGQVSFRRAVSGSQRQAGQSP